LYDHAEQHGEGLLRPRAHGDGLAADQIRGVDDEDVGIVEVLVERLPGPLEEQRVADGECRLLRALVLSTPMHGQDDEIAALGDHPREYRLPQQSGPGRDDDLRQTGRAVEEGVRDVAGRDL
jgi:hypothetical protein